MKDDEILKEIKKNLGDKVLELTNPAPRRIYLTVDREHVPEAVAFLKDKLDIYHVSTISGVDLDENFEIIYHMASLTAQVNLRCTAPRENPTVPTISEIIPGALLYEREIQDMFGIVVENIPDNRPLLLADDWPEGEYPLRKDWTFERPEEIIPEPRR